MIGRYGAASGPSCFRKRARRLNGSPDLNHAEQIGPLYYDLTPSGFDHGSKKIGRPEGRPKLKANRTYVTGSDRRRREMAAAKAAKVTAAKAAKVTAAKAAKVTAAKAAGVAAAKAVAEVSVR